MEIGRLSHDELAYELAIRGVTTLTTVDAMRKTLRPLVKVEKLKTFVWPVYPFAFADDVAALKAKDAEIRDLIHDFGGGETSPEFKKIQTKLCHAMGRLNRGVPASDADRTAKSDLLVSLTGLSVALRTKTRRFARSSTLQASHLNGSLAVVSPLQSDDGTSEDSDSDLAARPTHSVTPIKSVPVMQWRLKYTGDNKDLSLNAFLERVDELRVARHLNMEQVFESALDLFSGRALIWYRAVRKTISSWDELVVALREEFLPPDHDEQLFDEIRRRTQGPTETIGTYVAIMTNLFSRLAIKLPESSRIRIISKNLAPFYQNQLGLAEIKSLEHLKSMGRTLETRKSYVETYVPPPRRNQSIEPDLAYLTPSSTVASLANTSQPARKCWNCDLSGHVSANCKKPRRIHCYRCGEAGVTTRTCTKCSLNERRMR